MTTPSTPSRTADTVHENRAADAVWRRLCEGVTEPWLEDVRSLRSDHDDFSTSLDIWTVGLTAELKNPERRETASLILARLQRLAASAEEPAAEG